LTSRGKWLGAAGTVWIVRESRSFPPPRARLLDAHRRSGPCEGVESIERLLG